MFRRVLLLAVLAGVALPAAPARALNPNDSITAVAPASADTTDYVSFSGSGTFDGDDFGDTVEALYATPSSLPNGCADYATVKTQFPQSQFAETVGPGYTDSGPFTYSGQFSSLTTTPGDYELCTYLARGDVTQAVSDPAPFTVAAPAGPGPSSGFGGPGSQSRTTAITISPNHKIKAPGSTLLTVSGSYSGQTGAPPELTVTVKSTAAYNGCATTESEDENLTRTSGGSVIASDAIQADSADRFTVPVELHYPGKASGSKVICAYVDSLGQDLAVGSLRFSLPKVATHKKKHHKHKKKKHHHTR